MKLAVERLTMAFGAKTVLRGVSFEVGPGECVVLAGPNGAGKSTALKCVLGLLRYGGAIRVDGVDLRWLGARARERMAYVPQAPVFPKMTARQVVRFFARLRGLDPSKAEPILDRVSLAADAARPVHVFSGGMKQRLALGVAMLGEPDLLLLDEPSANLDAAGREALVRALADVRQAGRSLLISSHQSELTQALADRVITLNDGRVEADTRPMTSGGTTFVLREDGFELRPGSNGAFAWPAPPERIEVRP